MKTDFFGPQSDDIEYIEVFFSFVLFSLLRPFYFSNLSNSP